MGLRADEGLYEVVGAEQAQFLARPGGKEDVTAQGQFSAGLLIGEVFCHFEHSGDAGGVVVGTEVNLLRFLITGER